MACGYSRKIISPIILVSEESLSETRGKKIVPLMITFAGVSIAFLAIASQITIFVIQPLGMLPEGKTLVISRMSNTKFIDSAHENC